MIYPPTTVKRRSRWTFTTSGTGGLGIEFVATSGGTVVLADPEGVERRFSYGAAGLGLSIGIRKIPKIGRINPGRLDPHGLSDHVGGNIAPEAFWNHGAVYVMGDCPHDELAIDDFKGICSVVDAGAGLILGYSGSAMLVGIDPMWLAITAAMHSSPVLGLLAPPLRCRGMILSRGWNVGVQASAGITGQLGYMWPQG
ncbi:hypothetical protein [Sphingomonas bacterium]|uniref:hypothetical protein n=1 Tax=Sphingomonas bacterium TaxID=1895847 RepID=UPI001575DABB|nr:hypothetical protein [Sphingomonas bacterium]